MQACPHMHITHTFKDTHTHTHSYSVALPECLDQSIGNQLGGYVTVVIPFYSTLGLHWELERCCQVSQQIGIPTLSHTHTHAHTQTNKQIHNEHKLADGKHWWRGE